MKAMILAAGLGTRLGAVTLATPKCLVEVGGKTILECVVERLKNAGVTELVINLHHLKEQVEKFVIDKNWFGLSGQFTREDPILGTGGGIKNAAKYLDGEQPFFIHNADVYSEIDLGALYSTHLRSNPLATLAVMERSTSRPLLFDADAHLIGWENQKTGKSSVVEGKDIAARLAFSGVHVISPKIFKQMEVDEGAFDIIPVYVRAARSGERILAHRVDEAYWVDIGTPQTLDALRRRIGKKGRSDPT